MGILVFAVGFYVVVRSILGFFSWSMEGDADKADRGVPGYERVKIGGV